MLGYIYVLCEVTSDLPFYVGSTVNPKARLSQHRHELSFNHNSGVYAFIQKNNINFTLTVIDEFHFEHRNELLSNEYFWIEHFSQQGYTLTNKIKNSSTSEYVYREHKPKGKITTIRFYDDELEAAAIAEAGRMGISVNAYVNILVRRDLKMKGRI